MEHETTSIEPRPRPATKDDLFRTLDELDMTHQTLGHEAVFTVAESSGVEARLPGAHTKNLFLKDAKGRLFLIVAENQTKIDLKTLPIMIGSKRLSFAKPELLMEILGVEPGSVTAFAIMNDHQNLVSVVLDANLMTYESINCHPLRNDATTNIARDDLLRFLRHCGHDYAVVELAS